MTPRIVISTGQYGSLTHALECARLLAPLDHISIVASAHSEANARVQLAWYDGVELVVQPREQGNPDLLLPLTRVFARDPLSTVVFLPSEFCIVEPHALADAIRAALAAPDTFSVLGMAPFQWRSGASWNPFVAIGRTTRFWDLLRRHRPGHAALLECYLEAIGTDDEGTTLVAAYQHMEPIDFTGDLLVRARPVDLATVPSCAVRSNVGSVLARGRVVNDRRRRPSTRSSKAG